MAAYPTVLIDQHGNAYPCTYPERPGAICGDRWSPRPHEGTVLTAAHSGKKYLLLDCEPIMLRGYVKHFKLDLVELTHSLTIQRFVDNELATIVSDVPCKIQNSTFTTTDAPDRSRSITRHDIWLPYSPAVKKNDRVVLDNQSFMVIGQEHLSTVSRIIVKSDFR